MKEELSDIEKQILRDQEFLQKLKVAVTAKGPEHEDEFYSKGEFVTDDDEIKYRAMSAARTLSKEIRQRQKRGARELMRSGGPIILWTFNERKKGITFMDKKEEKMKELEDEMEEKKNLKTKKAEKKKKKIEVEDPDLDEEDLNEEDEEDLDAEEDTDNAEEDGDDDNGNEKKKEKKKMKKEKKEKKAKKMKREKKAKKTTSSKSDKSAEKANKKLQKKIDRLVAKEAKLRKRANDVDAKIKKLESKMK